MLCGYLICNRQKWMCLGWKFGGVSGGRAGTGCVWDSHTPPRPCPVSVTWVQLSHPALPTLSQREALPWKGNALKAGVGEQVGTRRTVSGTLSYPMALLHHRWQVGLVIFFPWVLFALVAFNLYLEIIVDLQKSCKEHTHNFHIPLSQFPLIFRDNGTFVKTENFNLDAALFTEYLLLFLRFSHGYPCLFQDPRPGPVLPLVTLSP